LEAKGILNMISNPPPFVAERDGILNTLHFIYLLPKG